MAAATTPTTSPTTLSVDLTRSVIQPHYPRRPTPNPPPRLDRLGAGLECYPGSGLRSAACGHDQGSVPVDTRGWYVLVTSPRGKSVFAMLGPYATQEIAERKARDSRVVHYRVEMVTSSARRYVRSRLAGSRTR